MAVQTADALLSAVEVKAVFPKYRFSDTEGSLRFVQNRFSLTNLCFQKIQIRLLRIPNPRIGYGRLQKQRTG